MDKQHILSAMRADSIPADDCGLWFITKTTLTAPVRTVYHDCIVTLPPGTYTHLYRITDSTIMQNPPGEAVMEDTPFELRTHLDFVMRARGNVLVSGLGLGCVVRGLLLNPNVYHVTCLENSRDVLKLVAPYMPTERLTIVEADALEWTAQNQARFDYAWHDLWTDRDSGEPHLDRWHLQLVMNCRKTVSVQGAWSFDRGIKRILERRGLQLIG